MQKDLVNMHFYLNVVLNEWILIRHTSWKMYQMEQKIWNIQERFNMKYFLHKSFIYKCFGLKKFFKYFFILTPLLFSWKDKCIIQRSEYEISTKKKKFLNIHQKFHKSHHHDFHNCVIKMQKIFSRDNG